MVSRNGLVTTTASPRGHFRPAMISRFPRDLLQSNDRPGAAAGTLSGASYAAVETTRVTRRLINVASGVSLLLCLLLGGAWFRSLGHYDWIYYENSGRAVIFESSNGEVLSHAGSIWDTSWASGEPRHGLHRHSSQSVHEIGLSHPWPEPLRLLGFGTNHSRDPASELWGILLPYWLLCTTTAIPPLLWFRRRRRQYRGRSEITCRKCGYDLRATPERCPECGAIPNRASKVAT
jgi:hypothetical protein